MQNDTTDLYLRNAARRGHDGWSFILMGVAVSLGAYIPFFGTGFGAGLLLALIGWYLNNAARTATTKPALDAALSGHYVAELMRRDGAVVSPDLLVTSL